jgi:hypothetical protein
MSVSWVFRKGKCNHEKDFADIVSIVDSGYGDGVRGQEQIQGCYLQFS